MSSISSQMQRKYYHMIGCLSLRDQGRLAARLYINLITEQEMAQLVSEMLK